VTSIEDLDIPGEVLLVATCCTSLHRRASKLEGYS